MSQWSRENPEGDPDEWADSMREEADQRRKEQRAAPPHRNGNGGFASKDRRPILGGSNYRAAAIRALERKRS